MYDKGWLDGLMTVFLSRRKPVGPLLILMSLELNTLGSVVDALICNPLVRFFTDEWFAVS